MPATGWYALYARRVETGDELRTEPLIAWALVEETFEDDDVDAAPVIERSVVGLVNYGVQDTVATDTEGFVLEYVQAHEDLEPRWAMAETLLLSWERRERDDLDQHFPRN